MSEVQIAARHPWYITHLCSEERHHLADFFQLLLELARGVSVGIQFLRQCLILGFKLLRSRHTT